MKEINKDSTKQQDLFSFLFKNKHKMRLYPKLSMFIFDCSDMNISLWENNYLEYKVETIYWCRLTGIFYIKTNDEAFGDNETYTFINQNNNIYYFNGKVPTTKIIDINGKIFNIDFYK